MLNSPNPLENLSHREHSLAERVLARKAQLEQALQRTSGKDAKEPKETVERMAIESALAAVDSLLTGDIEHPSDVVAHDLVNWLERTKNLGLVARRPLRHVPH